MLRAALCAIVLLCSLHLSAQKVGIKAGFVMSGYSATGRVHTNPNQSRIITGTSFKPGFTLGSNVDLKLSGALFLRTGLELVLKGGNEEAIYTYNGGSVQGSSRYNFVAFDVPVQLLYKLPAGKAHQLLMAAGVVPGILIEGGLNKGDLGLGLMLGYQLSNGFNCQLSYNHGLLNVASNSFDYTMLKNRAFAMTLGYQFGSSSKTKATQVLQEQSPATTENSGRARAFFAELGGSGGFLSLNYDARFKSNKGLGFRLGLGTITDLNSFGLTIPLSLNYLIGERTHFLELGAGATYFNFSEMNQDSWFSFRELQFIAPHAWIGYRYQPEHRKFFFRAGVNKFFGDGLSGFISEPFPGLSFGLRLR